MAQPGLGPLPGRWGAAACWQGAKGAGAALGARWPVRVSGLLEDTCLLVVSWHLPSVRVHGAGARPGPPGWQEGAGQDASPRQQLMTQIYYLITAYRSQMVVSINSAIFGGAGGE